MIVRKWCKQGEALLKEIRETKTDKDEVALWHLGQCGFVYKNQDTVVYIDPLLNDLIEDGETRRWYRWPFEPEQVEADFIVCTHGHADHLAVPTLVGIAKGNEHTKFVIPAAYRELLLENGIAEDRIVCLKAREKMELPGLSVYPVSAAHPVHEQDENGFDLALCYQMVMGDVSLLHMGDTYLTDQLFEDLKGLPKTDLFFPPINGGDFFRTARNCIGNLDMIESATLACVLKVDMTIPTHYDMVMDNTVDPLRFVQILWEMDPAAKCHITGLGERFIYRK
ncbi:MAG: MBL fold metallo-hydrolase [Clostridiales bacterium]|nr:MBL fold metallo-hydrolase [Candidatus Blautia equi]